MTRLKTLIVICFALTFAAGLVVGLAGESLRKPPDRHSWLQRELTLTREQSQAMQRIWSDLTGTQMRNQGEQRHVLEQERQAALRAILSDEQAAEYDQVNALYDQRQAELSAQRRRNFDNAVEQTKALLSDEQRVKYEQLMRSRGGRPPFGGRGGPGRGEGAPPHGELGPRHGEASEDVPAPDDGQNP